MQCFDVKLLLTSTKQLCFIQGKPITKYRNSKKKPPNLGASPQLEYWNTGILEYWVKRNIIILELIFSDSKPHCSTIATLHHSMSTVDTEALKNCFISINYRISEMFY